MKLDERGFPTEPIMPHEAAAAWAARNVKPQDLADFWGSQSRLHRRKARLWRAVFWVALIAVVAQVASFVISLIRALS